MIIRKLYDFFIMRHGWGLEGRLSHFSLFLRRHGRDSLYDIEVNIIDLLDSKSGRYHIGNRITVNGRSYFFCYRIHKIKELPKWKVTAVGMLEHSELTARFQNPADLF